MIMAAIAAVAAADPRKLTLLSTVTIDLDSEEFDAKTKWPAWKQHFNKKYATLEEEAKAMQTFAQWDDFIISENKKGLGYTVGHNEFSDMTNSEFAQKMTGWRDADKYLNKPKNYDHTLTAKAEKAPSSVDWSKKGAVTPIKNQGQCGSCWAFSTTGSTEGNVFINTGKLISLAEQDLVDCDRASGDNGCSGGLMDNAFGFIIKNGGICAEKDYPYHASDGTCNKQCQNVVTITGHTDVPKMDEKALVAAIAQQPVSVAIEADKPAFQMYKSGVYNSTGCGTQLDHGVLAVGYGTENGQDYYKVKNSWGASWGAEGYILLARNVNQCGISQCASYPTGGKTVAPGPSPGPAPGPSPGPSPGPAPGQTHYGDPLDGPCMKGEENVTVTGVKGPFCSPQCTAGIFCPSDKPAGVTAKPQCALQTSAGAKYCALICSPSTKPSALRAGDAQCGAKASCKPISGVGLCTYDE
jgi:KDEL-tailed cysteine endopeptidase